MPQPSENIIRFYRNQIPDDSGRMLDEILKWDNDQLEYTHNYIQWLFPNVDLSPVNPNAPVVDRATIAAFHDDIELRKSLARAFNRMAAFYGLAVHGDELSEGVRVELSSQWNDRKANWLQPHNHNMLRITRIIKCLRLLGLESLAQAFFDALRSIFGGEGREAIGWITYGYWKFAATKPM